MSKLFNQPMTLQEATGNTTQAQLFNNMVASLNASAASGVNPHISVGIALDPDANGNVEGHEIAVNGIITDPNTGAQVVEYTNPWGSEELMSAADFTNRMYTLVAPTSTLPSSATSVGASVGFSIPISA
jgi:hypothetical protein